ncbi:hypothetical protein KIPB_013009, partial [Kipferlia bialata]|eukprot:g13009.t1
MSPWIYTTTLDGHDVPKHRERERDKDNKWVTIGHHQCLAMPSGHLYSLGSDDTLGMEVIPLPDALHSMHRGDWELYSINGLVYVMCQTVMYQLSLDTYTWRVTNIPPRPEVPPQCTSVSFVLDGCMYAVHSTYLESDTDGSETSMFRGRRARRPGGRKTTVKTHRFDPEREADGWITLPFSTPTPRVRGKRVAVGVVASKAYIICRFGCLWTFTSLKGWSCVKLTLYDVPIDTPHIGPASVWTLPERYRGALTLHGIGRVLLVIGDIRRQATDSSTLGDTSVLAYDTVSGRLVDCGGVLGGGRVSVGNTGSDSICFSDAVLLPSRIQHSEGVCPVHLVRPAVYCHTYIGEGEERDVAWEQ